MIRCNLCGWETEDNNHYGIQRHQEWHEDKLPNCRTAVITDEVKWILISNT